MRMSHFGVAERGDDVGGYFGIRSSKHELQNGMREMFRPFILDFTHSGIAGEETDERRLCGVLGDCERG